MELRLKHVNTTDPSFKPFAQFDELPGETFEDFQIAKLKIDELTDKIAGTKKNIINQAIKMTVFSNTCPDLTIVDLPGITRIPLYGQKIIRVGPARRHRISNKANG